MLVLTVQRIRFVGFGNAAGNNCCLAVVELWRNAWTYQMNWHARMGKRKTHKHRSRHRHTNTQTHKHTGTDRQTHTRSHKDAITIIQLKQLQIERQQMVNTAVHLERRKGKERKGKKVNSTPATTRMANFLCCWQVS